MKTQYLGHVVFYVKDFARSLTSGRMHHEPLLIQAGDLSNESLVWLLPY